MTKLADDKVYLIIRSDIYKDDVISIWTTKALADAAVFYHEGKTGHHYEVKEWKVNVTTTQWD